MSDFQPEKKKREQREQREQWDMSQHAAEYRAMPLRSIAVLELDGRVALLNCGHRKALLVWLLVGENVRCRDCYEEGMKKAQYLVEGSGA